VAIAHVDDAKLAYVDRRTKAAGVWNCVTLLFAERFAALDDRDALLRLPAVKYVSPEQLAVWIPRRISARKA
jgi:hypothetical protein